MADVRSSSSFASSFEETIPLKGAYRFEPQKEENPWGIAFAARKDRDEQMCKSWKEEIDTLLVFAGLFTAIVSSFLVESSKWLQPDPSAEMVRSVLLLVQKLDNATVSASISSTEPFIPAPSVVRINCLWFLAMTITLTASLIAILCKQWLREFQRDSILSVKETLALRELRFRGWKRWGMEYILSFPALLIQAALILFLAGVLDLLWHRLKNLSIAAASSSIIGLAALVIVSTAVSPAIYHFWCSSFPHTSSLRHPCPYRSPQSQCLVRLVEYGRWIWTTMTEGDVSHPVKDYQWSALDRESLHTEILQCGSQFNRVKAKDAYLSLALLSLLNEFTNNTYVRDQVFHCLQENRMICSKQRKHLFFCKSEDDCEDDRDPDSFLLCPFLFDSEQNEEFCLEVVLRSHLTQVATLYTTRMIFYIARGLGSQTPRPLALETLRCFLGILRDGADIPDDGWYSVFAMCIPSHEYDDKFDDILVCFSQRLSENPFEVKKLAQQFLVDLWLFHMHHRYKLHNRFLFHSLTRDRVVVSGFVNLIRRLNKYCPPNLEAAWCLLKGNIVYQTSLPKNFFENGSEAILDVSAASQSQETLGGSNTAVLSTMDSDAPSPDLTKLYHSYHYSRERALTDLVKSETMSLEGCTDNPTEKNCLL